MSEASSKSDQAAESRYQRDECAVFCRIRDEFGMLSNMHPGYPLFFGDAIIGSSEALYQALRYPDRPDVQSAILSAGMPMAAKRVAYDPAWYLQTRSDWLKGVNVQSMQLAVALKLWSYSEDFAALAEQIGERTIVEFSRKDPFWGAQPDAVSDGYSRFLIGRNMLGQIWMQTMKVWQQHGDSALLCIAENASHGLVLQQQSMLAWLERLEKPSTRQASLWF